MFKKIFSKKKEISEKYVLIAALLVHAARIDNIYSEDEKKIIKKAIINLDQSNSTEIEKILEKAEKKEEESNQILEFTKEIKKYSSDFRFKIIELLWEIVYSDGTNDIYESNLIRRVCGLLYVSDKENGIIKLKVQKKLK
tara:strand:+ start:2576 stop:2995 length:420 start_codon:yes stop_codon:yes gene_type:complete